MNNVQKTVTAYRECMDERDIVIDLIGSVVRQAMADCCNVSIRSGEKNVRSDAIDFIFGDRLRDFVGGMNVNAEHIRKETSRLMNERSGHA